MAEKVKKHKGGYRQPKLQYEELLQQALDLCKKGGLLTIQDVIAYLPVNSSRFYDYFPAKSEGNLLIQEALEKSKRKACVSIRSRLYAMANNPTAQITVYKMLCSEEERAALSMTKTDITTNGKEIKTEPLVIEVIDSRDKVEQTEV